MTTQYQVYSYLGFRAAATNVSLHTATRLARALRKHSGCGWVVRPVVTATIDGREMESSLSGIVGGMRLCDALRDPRRVVDLAWGK